MPDPKRILIVRLSHLGDVVHALPVYHVLAAGFPDAELGWAVQPEYADLVAGLPRISRVIRFGRKERLKAWSKLRREFRTWRPDWTIDCQGNVKSGFVTRFSGAERRTGLAKQDWREPFGARFINDQAPPAYGKHAIHRMLMLAGHAARGPEPRFDLPLSDAELDGGRALLAQHLPPGAGPLRILHPGVAGDPRSWPEASYATLASRLSRAGERVLIITGPDEGEVGARIAAALSSEEDIRHWIAQRGLRDLAAVFRAAAEMGGRLAAGDSGPMHIAAAVQLGVDLIAGPQDPSLTGPWPLPKNPDSIHRVHRAEGDAPATSDLAPETVADALLAQANPDLIRTDP